MSPKSCYLGCGKLLTSLGYAIVRTKSCLYYRPFSHYSISGIRVNGKLNSHSKFPVNLKVTCELMFSIKIFNITRTYLLYVRNNLYILRLYRCANIDTSRYLQNTRVRKRRCKFCFTSVICYGYNMTCNISTSRCFS